MNTIQFEISKLQQLLQLAFEAGKEYERSSEDAIIGESIGKDGDVDFHQWLKQHSELIMSYGFQIK